MSPIPAPRRRKPQVHGLFYWLFLLSYVNYCDQVVQTRFTPYSLVSLTVRILLLKLPCQDLAIYLNNN